MSAGIDYTWAGKPAQGHNRGQDTIGADLFSKKFPKQPIRFWCLKSELGHYQGHFKKKPNVQVMCIEEFLAEHDQDLLTFVNEILASAKRLKDPADKARELVTIKELMQYFLCQHFEGYKCDTTVGPNEESDTPPKSHQHYRFPFLHIPDRDPRSGPKEFPDPWLMYSPGPDKDKEAKARFQWFFSRMKEEFHGRSRDFRPMDRGLMGRNFVTAAQDSPGAKPFDLQISHQQYNALVCDEAFAKVYCNTHRAHAKYLPPLVHRYLHSGPQYRAIAYMLTKQKFDTSQVYSVYRNDGMTDETSLLHEAVKIGDPKRVFLVAMYAKSLSPKAKPGPFHHEGLTPLELANSKGWSSSIDALHLAMAYRAFHPDTSRLLKIISIVYRLSAHQVLPSAPDSEEIESILRLIDGEENPALSHTLKAIGGLGDVTVDSVEAYLDSIKKYHEDTLAKLSEEEEKSAKPVGAKRGFFTPPPKFSEDEARQTLLREVRIPKSKL